MSARAVGTRLAAVELSAEFQGQLSSFKEGFVDNLNARHPRRAGSPRQVLVSGTRPHKDAPGASFVILPPPDGSSARGENPGSEQHSLVQARKSKAGDTRSPLKPMTLPARKVFKKMHCSSMRDAGGSALCRYNDNADIAPPHLCSTPRRSSSMRDEAEALNA